MHVSRIILSAGIVALGAGAAWADPILFVNDYEGFVEAAGDVQTIDFETLPDGSPSIPGTEITPDFNYTDQGVAFSPAVPRLWILGSPGGFYLDADSYPSFERNWMIADLVIPAWAVGIFFPSSTSLSVFDENDALIASASYQGGGSGKFLGIVSDLPIVSAIGDKGSSSQVFESFVFAPIPEPTTVMLLTLGAVMVIRRRHRCLQSRRIAGRVAHLFRDGGLDSPFSSFPHV